jgi:SNF2 family DNA or RNA helicase
MTFNGSLREYQEHAVDRMVDRGQMLLGMVMGAGKTPTTIAACERLHGWGEIERTLVIVPSALKYQWRDELSKFAPDARVVVVDGTKSERDKQWRLSIGARYVIINPESLLNDEKKVGEYQCVVVDEATMIKTRYSGRTKVKRTALVKRMGKKVYYRFALTGQPIENKPEELFSIMEFVDPEVLGNWEMFDTTFIVRDSYGKPERYRNLDLVYTTLQDTMIRYSFDDIKDQMPDVIHQVIPVEFDTPGANLYRTISRDLLLELRKALSKARTGFSLYNHYNGGADAEAQGEIMTRLTSLKMLCDNPRLLTYSAIEFGNPHTKAGSKYAATLHKAQLISKVKATPKLDACMSYVEDVLAEDPKNKVVLFSFFKQNLHYIGDHLTRSGHKSVRFDGDMDSKEKDASKTKFATDPECRVFLSSDAGGYGVDLPMANYLISYDLPWSSGKLEQREARIIRLSSEFPHVTIASFVMKGSIEERQHELLQHKKKINEAWIDGKHHDASQGMEIDVGTLTTFLENTSV